MPKELSSNIFHIMEVVQIGREGLALSRPNPRPFCARLMVRAKAYQVLNIFKVSIGITKSYLVCV